MRARSLLRESLLGHVARRWLSLAAVLLVAGMSASSVMIELLDADRVENLQLADALEGANVLIVKNPAGAISSDECVWMAGWRGVSASGWIVSDGTVVEARSPGNPFQRSKVSSDFLAILDPSLGTSSAPGTYVGSAVAAELGIRPGDSMTLGDGSVVLSGVINADSRSVAYSRRLFDVVDSAALLVDECWLVAASGSLDAVVSAAKAGFRDSDLLTISRLAVGGFETEFSHWLSRPLQVSWLFSGLFAGLVCCLLLWLRQKEFHLYRSLGLTVAEVALIFAVYLVVLIAFAANLVGALASVLSYVLFTEWHKEGIALALSAGFLSLAVAFITGLIATLLLAARPVRPAARDR